MNNENKKEVLNDQELEQAAGGVNVFPNPNGGTAIYTGNGNDFYIDGPAIAPTTGITIPVAPVIPVGGSNYTVQAGDNLSKIAKAYGTTVANLMALNPQIADANKIYVGQVIRIS